MSAPDDPPVLLLTRPAEASRRVAAALGAGLPAGGRVIVSPLLEIEAIGGHITPEQSLILTSQNAVARLTSGAGLSAWCVGPRTAAAAERAGLEVRAVAPTAEALLAQIVAAGETGPFLHLRGDKLAFPLAERLNQAGIETHEQVVYRQKPQPLTPEAGAVLTATGRVVVPLFSPESARRFLAEAKRASARLEIVAISEAVARICSDDGIAVVSIAASPDGEAMKSAVLRQLATSMPG